MAIIKQTVPYEYLVRFRSDGTAKGQHIKYLERVFDEDTGQVYAELELDPLPVGSDPAEVPLQTALGTIAAATAKAEEAAREKQTELEVSLAALVSRKEALENEIALEVQAKQQLQAELNAERADNAKLRLELAVEKSKGKP